MATHCKHRRHAASAARLLADPARLLEGGGRFMRHVKLGPGRAVDAAALAELVATAYADMKARLLLP